MLCVIIVNEKFNVFCLINPTCDIEKKIKIIPNEFLYTLLVFVVLIYVIIRGG